MAQEFTFKSQALMLDFLDTLTLFVSAHTASPNLTGANEHTLTGSPTYARKAVAYDVANVSDGTMAITASVTLDIDSVDITYIGIFDAVTSGNFIGQVLIPTESFGSQGTLEVTALTLDLNEVPA
jgi:hypothetical protein